MQEPIAGSRIVSRGAYAVNVGKKAGLSSFGVGFLVAGAIAALLTLMMLYDLTGSDVAEGVVIDKGWLRLWTPIVAGTCLLLLYLGRRAMKQVAKVEHVVPLTRANTAALPANDSLVRASQEPAQAQEGVLLRVAAGEAQAGKEEQLLKAAAGGQE